MTDQTGNDGSRRELSISGYILKIDARGFSGGLVVGCESRDWQF